MTALEKRHSALRTQMLRSPSLKPKLTPSKIAAFVMAALIHLATLAIALYGLYWIVRAILSTSENIVIFIFLGVGLLSIAWAVAPRFFFKVPEKVLDRQTFPAIYSLADGIAECLNIPPVDGIVFNYNYNAAITRIGLKNRTYVFLGVPLWFVLDEQEKVALMAHELAHAANGDFRGTLVVNSAVQSLERWYFTMRIMVPGFHMLFIAFFRWCVWTYLYWLRRLLFQESQRAEYLADSLSANVSGTEAVTRALYKTGFGYEYQSFLKRNVESRRTDRLLDRFRNYITDLPEEMMKDIARTREEREALYGLTHPPLAYRMELLKNFPVANPKIVLSAEQSAALQREFLRVEQEVQSYMTDAARNRFMYR